MTIHSFLVLITVIFGASAVHLAFPGGTWEVTKRSLALSLLGSVIIIAGGFSFWLAPMNVGITIWRGGLLVHGFPEFSYVAYIDSLASVFLLLVGIFSFLVTVFSFSYLRHIKRAREIVGAYSLFILSTVFTVAANSVFGLLMAMEIMSLAFAYLVLYRHNKERDADIEWSFSRKQSRLLAITSYLSFSHLSLLLASAGLIAFGQQVGSYDFDIWRTASVSPHPVILVLIVLAFGIRAGIAPFHIWIPLAHPSSPTNTHAFSLGVAVKISLFLLIRFTFELFGTPSLFVAVLTMLLGGLTALAGVYTALISHDLKTALSSHTVENIGIILAATGLALTYKSLSVEAAPDLEIWAGVALFAALLHIINHAVFKGLLYLVTGAVETLTGTVEYEELGGLVHAYPHLTGMFIVGSMSISALPLFNGFVSELLILLAFTGGVIQMVGLGNPVLIGIIVLVVLMLATAFGRTLFAFVKIAGVTFMGAPRDPATHLRYHKQNRVPWSMYMPILFLSATCLVLGIFPGLLGIPFVGVVRELGLDTAVQFETFSRFAVGELMRLDLLSIFIVVGLPFIVLSFLSKILCVGKPEEKPVWSSGELNDPLLSQYTAGSIAERIYRARFLHRLKKTEQTEFIPVAFAVTAMIEAVDLYRLVYERSASWLIKIARKTANAVEQNALMFSAIVLVLMLIVLTGVMIG